jgi:PAS domain S-box-containing protein
MKDGIAWALFVAALALLGAGAVEDYRDMQRLMGGLNAIAYNHAVIAAVDDLQGSIRVTTASIEGPVITGRKIPGSSASSGLEEFASATPGKIAALRKLTLNNQAEQAELAAIDQLSRQYIEALRNYSPPVDSQRIATEPPLPPGLQKLQRLDRQMHSDLDSIRTEQVGLLEQQEQASANIGNNNKAFSIFFSVLGMLLLSIAFFGIEYHLKERRKAEIRLTKLNDELEEHVAKRVAQFHEINRNLIMEAVKREQAEEDVQQQHEFLRMIIDTDPNLIFVKNWDGKFTLVNRALAQIYGTTAENLIGKNDADFNKNHEQVQHFRRDDQAVIASRKAKFIPEEPVTNAGTGEVRWFQTYKVPLVTAGNSVSHLLGVSTDITERKVAEEELARAQQQLVQSQKLEAVGRLAGGLAHDFNNILGVVLGYGEQVLQTLHKEADERRYVQRIVEAGNRAARLVQQLLAFSRKQVLQPRVISLNAIVLEMKQLLDRLAGENIEIKVNLAPDLGSVKADPAQLERVVMNLVVNARDAMPEGGKLILETANAELDDSYISHHAPVVPGRYVMLAISDTGVGIDADMQSKIFDPFFTTKGPNRGTGLGLSIVHGIINQSGGYIWVYSEAGKGATFKIYLPLVDAKAEPISVAANFSQQPTGTETILVVEDDKLLREFICEVLGANGYTVLPANNGAEAIEVCRKHKGPIGLLLTDVVMPGMSGRTLANQINPTRPAMKVLYMSGYTEDAIVHHGVLDTGVQLIQKPFTIGALARKVRELLEDKKPESC